MLRSPLLACISGIALLGAAGCGSSTDSHAPGALPQSRVPPSPPAETPGDPGARPVVAISKLYLGDTDRDGTPNKIDGWKDYGFDLDGKITSAGAKDVCKPAAGAPPSASADGADGIDNSFGKNVLPLLLGIVPDASTQVNNVLLDGKFTVMLSIEGLGPDPVYNPLLTKLYVGGDLGHPPAFDGTDAWPVLQEFLVDPTDIDTPKVAFPGSYVVDDVWVSGSKAKIDLNLSIAGYTLALSIDSALVSMQLDPDHKGATLGTIAGVLDTEALLGQLRNVAGAVNPSFCDPNNATFQNIANQIQQASDILKDGSQDPGKECDGISIGLGFDMEAVDLGGIAPPVPAPPSPCMESAP